MLRRPTREQVAEHRLADAELRGRTGKGPPVPCRGPAAVTHSPLQHECAGHRGRRPRARGPGHHGPAPPGDSPVSAPRPAAKGGPAPPRPGRGFRSGAGGRAPHCPPERTARVYASGGAGQFPNPEEADKESRQAAFFPETLVKNVAVEGMGRAVRPPRGVARGVPRGGGLAASAVTAVGTGLPGDRMAFGRLSLAGKKRHPCP